MKKRYFYNSFETMHVIRDKSSLQMFPNFDCICFFDLDTLHEWNSSKNIEKHIFCFSLLSFLQVLNFRVKKQSKIIWQITKHKKTFSKVNCIFLINFALILSNFWLNFDSYLIPCGSTWASLGGTNSNFGLKKTPSFNFIDFLPTFIDVDWTSIRELFLQNRVESNQ